MALLNIRFFATALLAASLTVMTGCGSSGGGSSGGGDAPLMPGTNQVTGPADPIQDVILDLNQNLGAVPVLGDTVEALLGALVSLLDAPDGLAGGFQEFLMTQDPQSLINGGQDAGDAILSFAASVTEVLIQLTEEGNAIPGAEAVIASLTSLQMQVQDGFTGETEGGDLTLITNTLVDLAGNLTMVSEQIPPQVTDAPLVGDLVAALAQGSQDLVVILDSVGQLDGEATSNALVGSFQNILAALTGALPGGFDTQLNDAVAQATTTFSGGLALLLDPLFTTLRAVLAPVTGADGPLNNILPGLLTGNLAGLGGIAGLGNLLGGGGTTGEGLPIPVLGDLLAGLPLLGDLLGGAAGSDAGGLPLLGDVLSGNGNLPLLGDLLQGLPGLSGPQGGEASLPIIGDLLTSLLSLNGDGIPVISDLLAGGTDADGGLNIPIIGGLLDGLLDGLLGLAGGTDSSGGFLDGLNGVPILGGLVGGLLGGLLGGLG